MSDNYLGRLEFWKASRPPLARCELGKKSRPPPLPEGGRRTYVHGRLEDELHKDLRAWFSGQDERALRRVVRDLEPCLRPSSGLLRVISRAELDELRSETLCRLLLGDQKLRQARNARAIARKAFERDCLSFLRRRIRRDRLAKDEGRQSLWSSSTIDPRGDLDDGLDLATALRVAEQLDFQQRLAVLLRIAPDRIGDRDWALVVERHEANPTRPLSAVDGDRGSTLLFAPASSESKTERRDRIERFRKLFDRACLAIRNALKEPSP